MSFLNEFMSQYGTMILYAVLTAIAGFLGTQLKKLYERYITDKTKKDVVKTCVKAVEQLYKDLHGEYKKQKAVESITAMLAEKGITVTDLEMRMLIESAVAEFNKAFEKKTEVDEISSESGITE